MNQVSASKKTKRARHDYSPNQLSILIAEHSQCPYPNRERRRALAQELDVPETSIMVKSFHYFFNFNTITNPCLFVLQYWFQNRRRTDRNQGKILSPSPKTAPRKPYARHTESGTPNFSNCSNDHSISGSSDWISSFTDSSWVGTSDYGEITSYESNGDSGGSPSQTPDYRNGAHANWCYDYGTAQCYYPGWNGNYWNGWYPEMQSLPSFQLPFPSDSQAEQWTQPDGNYYYYNSW